MKQITPNMEEQIVKLYKAVIGRRGGLAKSKRKSKTSRANGRLGGRPRKVPTAV